MLLRLIVWRVVGIAQLLMLSLNDQLLAGVCGVCGTGNSCILDHDCRGILYSYHEGRGGGKCVLKVLQG